MSDDQIDELYPKIWAASAMENGPAKCAVLEEIIRLADVAQKVPVGYEARMALVQAGTFSGAPDKALVAFSWCLSQADKDPEQYSQYNLLWRFKWVVHSLGNFPQISKKQIDDMLDDMSERYERCGEGQSAVLMLRWKLAMKMGDKEIMKKNYALWQSAPRDALSDCAACVLDEQIAYENILDNDAKAVTMAEPIIQGRLSCAEVPHVTYGRLLLPLMRLQRLDEAAKLHQSGYRLASKSPALLDTIADHLVFLGLTDNLARGTKIFEKHLGWALEATDWLKRFHFFLAGQFFMERLMAAETTSLTIRLPRAFPAYQEKGEYEVADLHTWLAGETSELAVQFDQRNENKYFAGRIADLKELHALATPYPLK